MLKMLRIIEWPVRDSPVLLVTDNVKKHQNTLNLPAAICLSSIYDDIRPDYGRCLPVV